VCAVVNQDPSSGDDVYGCVVGTNSGSVDWYPTDPTDLPSLNDTICTGDDASPMSVVGETTIFCVSGQACVASFSDGACPGPDEGYEGFSGAVCAVVNTDPSTGEDVYGCVVAGSGGGSSIDSSSSASLSGTSSGATGASSAGDDNASYDDEDSDSQEEDDSDSEEDSGTTTTSDNPCRQQGFSPMSVVGQVFIFCIEGDPCVASNANGVCPGPGEGYENFPGARCEVVNSDPATGADVYGCVLDV
jgi:hypothetical protein